MQLDNLGAAQALKDGKVIAIPTETFFGLAADIRQPKAIEAIFTLKGRPRTSPLPLLVPSVESLHDLLSTPPAPKAVELMEAYWPGKLTLILPKANPELSPLIRANTTVAVRMDGHPDLLELLSSTQLILTGTSANLSGTPALTRGDEVSALFSSSPLYAGHFSSAVTPGGLASTILDLSSNAPSILRDGELSPTLVRQLNLT